MVAPVAVPVVAGAAETAVAGAGAAGAVGAAGSAGAGAAAGASTRGAAAGAVGSEVLAGTPADVVNRAVRRVQPSQQVAGGLLAALVAYPVLLNFLQGGPAQVRRWGRAKFFNQTATSTTVRGSVANAALAGVTTRPAPGGSHSGVVGTGLPGVGAASPAPSAGSPAAGAGAAIAFARAQIGDPYGWGANGPDRWDCSSLTQAAWRAGGVKIGRTTVQQRLAGRGVSRADLQPGDLVFTAPTHVVLYTGGGMVVHAPRTGSTVREVPLWAFWGARRVA